MTNNNQDLTGPREDGAIDRPELRTDRDPIAIATELVSDDPSVAELVDFRNAVPDTKFARESKRSGDEASRPAEHTRSAPCGHYDHGEIEADGAQLALTQIAHPRCAAPAGSYHVVIADVDAAEAPAGRPDKKTATKFLMERSEHNHDEREGEIHDRRYHEQQEELRERG